MIERTTLRIDYFADDFQNIFISADGATVVMVIEETNEGEVKNIGAHIDPRDARLLADVLRHYAEVCEERDKSGVDLVSGPDKTVRTVIEQRVCASESCQASFVITTDPETKLCPRCYRKV